MMWIRALGFIFLIVLSFPVFGLEIYRVIQKDCRFETGLVVSADDVMLGLLNLQGEFRQIRRDEISTILVFTSVNNPIHQIPFDDNLSSLLVNIYVDESDNSLFTGWPVRFEDDLAFFYDTAGKTYALDIHKITKIESVTERKAPLSSIDKSVEVQFGFGRNFPECSFLVENQKEKLQPMRILSDQIKIEKWFFQFQKGFLRIKRFQQRTLFYAKPRLYQDQSIIGAYRFIGGPDSSLEKGQEHHNPLPIYFQWSGGKPYLYQHDSWVGAKSSPLIPRVEPVFGFSSDIKAHLFHGSFLINIQNIVPGYPSMVRMAAEDPDYFSNVSKKETFVFPDFNYAALSGVDYLRSSWSGGFLYPVFGIQTGGEDGVFREVLASRGSPALRYRYIGASWQLRLLYAYTTYNPTDPSEKELAMHPTSWLVSGEYSSEKNDEKLNEEISNYTNRYLQRFTFNNSYFRLGFDWDVNEDVRFGADEIYLSGAYRETYMDSWNLPAPTYHNRVDYTNWITSLYVRHQFGKKIALSLYINHFYRDQESLFLNDRHQSIDSDFSVYTVLEFLL